jgi:hypothetical protein
MTVIVGPPRRRDEAWVSREVHRARALLIMAAIHGQTVRYGELSPFGHLHWYDRQVLGGVFDLCQLNGEPDLTAILAPAGEPSEDAVEAERVFAYWREARPVRPSERRTGPGPARI